jgi:hypothetical protein
MPFQDLHQFIAALEACHQLARIDLPVARELEITEITDRISKLPPAANKPLLFEHVKGFSMPLAINLFGSAERMALALGVGDLDELGQRLGALLRYVYLPASLPAILTAVRQSVGTAVAVLYVAELFATQHGLGYYIYLNGSTLFNYPKMYAGVLAMSLLGLGLYFAVDWLHHRTCPWQFTS